MRRAIATVAVALLLVTAGCNGIQGEDGNETATPTPGEMPDETDTPTPTPEDDTPTPTATFPTSTPGLTDEEETIQDGLVDFSYDLGEYTNYEYGTRYYNSDYYNVYHGNETVRLTVRLEGEVDRPIRQIAMDVTQATAEKINTSTPDLQKYGDGDADAYRPAEVIIELEDEGTAPVATWRIDAQQAVQYKNGQLAADDFAQQTDATMQLHEAGYPSTSRDAGHYLKLAELERFVQIHYVRQHTETNTDYAINYDNVYYLPDEERVSLEFTWDESEKDSILNPDAVIRDEYWRTARRAGLEHPEQLEFYAHRPNQDDVRVGVDGDDVDDLLSIPDDERDMDDVRDYLTNDSEFETVRSGSFDPPEDAVIGRNPSYLNP